MPGGSAVWTVFAVNVSQKFLNFYFHGAQVALILSRKQSAKKMKKKTLQGTKVTGRQHLRSCCRHPHRRGRPGRGAGLCGHHPVLDDGIGLAAELVFVGFTAVAVAGDSGADVGGKILHKAWGCYDRQQVGRSFYLSMVAKARAEVVRWQRVPKTVIHAIEEGEALERELGIKFAEPLRCEGAGGTSAGGA
jgi:hypothetical protein